MSAVSSQVGFTRLTAREDGVVDVCRLCGRDTHYGVRVSTVRESTQRQVEAFVCYDCAEVCHVIAVARMPCDKCRGKGHEGP